MFYACEHSVHLFWINKYFRLFACLFIYAPIPLVLVHHQFKLGPPHVNDAVHHSSFAAIFDTNKVLHSYITSML